MTERWREALELILVTALFSALTMPMLYPISLHPGSVIFDRWDGCLHTWILAWDVHKFTSGLSNFFDANIFWPQHDALAYSDHLIGSALLAAPFYLISGNPLLAHNMVGILSFILSGFGMYLLARHFIANRPAAFLAGLIFAYCPWRYSQLGHMAQMLTGQWMPFALLFLHRVIENSRWRDALFFGFFFTLQALCSFYLAAMMSAAVATILAAEFISKKFKQNPAIWTRLAMAAALSLVIIVPTTIPYYRVHREQGLERTEKECIELSADPLDYLAAPPWNRLWGFTAQTFRSKIGDFPNEKRLFPGIIALILAVVGFTLKNTGPVHRKPLSNAHIQKVYLALAIAAILLSLGPRLHIFWKITPVPMPYKLLYHLAPGFKALRVTSRFAYLFMLALAVLAAYGYNRLEMRLALKTREAKRARILRWALIILIGGGILAEYFSAPLSYHVLPTGDAIPAVYKWLANQPADSAIIEIPQFPEFAITAKSLYDPLGYTFMYYSIFHKFQPIANGRSGFIPPAQPLFWTSMLVPSNEAIGLARYMGIGFIVIHTAYYPGNTGNKVEQLADNLDGLKLEAVFGADRVYRVLNPAPRGKRQQQYGLDCGRACE